MAEILPGRFKFEKGNNSNQGIRKGKRPQGELGKVGKGKKRGNWHFLACAKLSEQTIYMKVDSANSVAPKNRETQPHNAGS